MPYDSGLSSGKTAFCYTLGELKVLLDMLIYNYLAMIGDFNVDSTCTE